MATTGPVVWTLMEALVHGCTTTRENGFGGSVMCRVSACALNDYSYLMSLCSKAASAQFLACHATPMHDDGPVQPTKPRPTNGGVFLGRAGMNRAQHSQTSR